jgi:gluconokinase
MSQRFVVMGVSGCGKSTVAQGLADRIGGVFTDGDALHPQANIDKMARGEPLQDADRWPWLRLVGQALAQDGQVIACSALRRSYRDLIAAEAGAPVTFLYLEGSREVLLERMAARPGHFMPVSLLDSQLATLEVPSPEERVVAVSINHTPEEIVTRFLAALPEGEL